MPLEELLARYGYVIGDGKGEDEDDGGEKASPSEADVADMDVDSAKADNSHKGAPSEKQPEKAAEQLDNSRGTIPLGMP